MSGEITKVQAEVSLYPLRQNDLAEPIQQFVESLKNDDLNVRTGSMIFGQRKCDIR